jgi:hypothetical protein
MLTLTSRLRTMRRETLFSRLLHVLGGSGNDRACAEFADNEVDHRDEVAV